MSTMVCSRLDEAIEIINSMVRRLDRVPGHEAQFAMTFAESKADYEKAITELFNRRS